MLKVKNLSFFVNTVIIIKVDICLCCCINSRVHTDFWIHNSRLFPKQSFLFSYPRLSNRCSIETLPKLKEQRLFPWCAANVQVRLNKIGPLAHKKISLVVVKSTLYSNFKKNQYFLPVFSRLHLYFPDFFQVCKICPGKLIPRPISRHFQDLKTLYESCN